MFSYRWFLIGVVGVRAAMGGIISGDLLVAGFGGPSLSAVNGRSGTTDYQLNLNTRTQEFGATGIAADANGDILVSAEFGTVGEIVRVNPLTGNVTTISSGGLLDDEVWNIITDPSGDMLADVDGAILSVDPETGVQSIVSSGGLLSRPIGMVLDSQGDIFVADHNFNGFSMGGVLEINPITGAQSVISYGGDFTQGVAGIDFDGSGNLLVTTPTAIIKVDISTGDQTVVSSGGLFESLWGIVGLSGNIVVADWARGALIQVNEATGTQRILTAIPGTEDTGLACDNACTALLAAPEPALFPVSTLLLGLGAVWHRRDKVKVRA